LGHRGSYTIGGKINADVSLRELKTISQALFFEYYVFGKRGKSGERVVRRVGGEK